MDGELKDLLGILFQRADAMQTCWNFYAGAVTAALGVVTAGKSRWLNRTVCAGLTAAFVVFAVGNFISLNAVRRQRAALVTLAEARIARVQDAARPAEAGKGSALRELVKAVAPPTPRQLWLFHGALDPATIAAIWGFH
jgi:hypothetical protein